MQKHILRTDFDGDPNVGLFAVVTDRYALVGNSLSRKIVKNIEGILRVRARRMLVADTELVGLFVAANGNGVVVPKITETDEVKALNRIARELDLNVLVTNVKETALGNLILVNDRGCVISKDLAPAKKDLRNTFGVDVEVGTIAGLDIVGACGVATNRGVLVHRGCSESELEHVENVLRVRGDIGSVSFGSPFVGAGVVANRNGFVTSRSTTGPELQRIDETLGFV